MKTTIFNQTRIAIAIATMVDIAKNEDTYCTNYMPFNINPNEKSIFVLNILKLTQNMLSSVCGTVELFILKWLYKYIYICCVDSINLILIFSFNRMKETIQLR